MGNRRAPAGATKTGSSGPIKGTRDFAKGVRNELRKVSWPNRDQLRQSTAVVLIIVLVLAVYVFAWDFVFRNLANLVFL